MIENTDVRAVRGGTGEAKCGGNYGASIRAGEVAEAQGYSQVLWLDGVERKYIEEVGAMNVMFLIGDEIVTIGGIVGRVVTIRENDLVIETGADRNKMKIERWAVNTNRTKAEQHQKEVEAAREAAKEKKNKKSKKDETSEEKKD